MKSKLGYLYSLSILLVFLLSACGPGPIPGTPPEQEDLLKNADSCREVYTEQIAAWDSGDYDRIREVYTADIVHYDGGPAFVGIEDVMNMARNMLVFFSDWGMAVGGTYISASDCLGIWENWNVMGFFEDDPGREFDLVEIEGDKISYWRLFYDEKFNFSPINLDLLEDFAAAWSSGDTQLVENLYRENARLDDSLFGISAVGKEEIGRVAAGFEKDHPDAAWELIYTFSESDDETQPDLLPSHGAIYQVTPGRGSGEDCPVQVGVILTPDSEGLIASQITMYSAGDLIACSWVK